ncbi:MAG: maleylpyruvate isomerase family mycothiol-dependent enzyme [Streptosporangiaceae bacterium]
MTQLDSERYYAQIAASTADIAALVDGADLTTPIPTCPEWTLRQLATHVGRGQRWAATIVSTRSAEFIPFRSVPDGRLPDDPAVQAAWLAAGAEQLSAAVREAGQDRVWAFAGLTPAAFWARRMCHETVVHAADAMLAAGRPVGIDADIAADGIDEWLTVLTVPEGTEPDQRAAALPPGRSLHVHATDEGLAGAGEWLLRHEPDGVQVDRAHGQGDAAVTGPADRLFMVLMRRAPAGDPALTVYGDASVLAGWLAGTAF